MPELPPADAGRRRLLQASAATVVAAALPGSYARLAAAAAVPPASPPLRTLTAGLRVDAADPAASLERAAAFLAQGRALFTGAGYTVQTTRIVTQPATDYLAGLPDREPAARLAAMQAAAAPNLLGIGPVHAPGRSPQVARKLALAAASRGIACSLPLDGSAATVDAAAVQAAAKLITALAARDPAANFNFAALARVPPGVPFFPAGFHDGQGDAFALGLEGAGLFLATARGMDGLAAGSAPLTAAWDAALRPVETLALQLAEQTGWRYLGIDPTPAQWGENSIAAAVESVTGAPFGKPGTLAACRLFTQALRATGVRQTGYRGLFLPPMEDATLAKRAYKHYGLDALLAYSAVCGTGLDTVALPGDVRPAELERILRDVASLAIQWQKPLSARLFPVPGRQAGESTGPVGELFPMTILTVR